ncbi:LITAF domain-containing protein [Caenorhabditis elegans]|uniref:LITAF domain-containing protein n=1 Tax=Caenorhabditis elegans TaxID=6239 RepID=Q7YTJ4_CAEEL|nr:LITAF domain-containing protein [Caenorhabditis elegans]CAE17974.1 LITAF domain-containing protein [Caenorhabditis elegans]|eukprot:NP_001022834.1 Uncharacterized protein CELE_Y37D8A.26 [Caenorhabditis elegans]
MLNVNSCAPKSEEVKYVVHKTPYLEFCTNCQETVTTKTEQVFGMLNFALFITCLFLPCFIVCFWCRCFMDVHHRCPNCNKSLGKRDRI